MAALLAFYIIAKLGLLGSLPGMFWFLLAEAVALASVLFYVHEKPPIPLWTAAVLLSVHYAFLVSH